MLLMYLMLLPVSSSLVQVIGDVVHVTVRTRDDVILTMTEIVTQASGNDSDSCVSPASPSF